MGSTRHLLNTSRRRDRGDLSSEIRVTKARDSCRLPTPQPRCPLKDQLGPTASDILRMHKDLCAAVALRADKWDGLSSTP